MFMVHSHLYSQQAIAPNDGNWHHVMGTFDGTTDANGLKYLLMALYFKQLLEAYRNKKCINCITFYWSK